MQVFRGLGTGAFAEADTLESGPRFDDLAVADFDLDGRWDIAAVSFERMSVFVGGDGDTFDPPFVMRDAEFGRDVLGAGDLAEDGYPDLALVYDWAKVFLNTTVLDPFACRKGNVNRATSASPDVLFVKDSPGAGFERLVEVATGVPIEIRMAPPPSNPLGPSRFSVYAWARLPQADTVRLVSFGLGVTGLPTPLSGGPPFPKEVFNNIGHPARLGASTRPSAPAPSVLLRLENGLANSIDFYLQGFIIDDASPSGLAAVTNGVVVSVN